MPVVATRRALPRHRLLTLIHLLELPLGLGIQRELRNGDRERKNKSLAGFLYTNEEIDRDKRTVIG